MNACGCSWWCVYNEIYSFHELAPGLTSAFVVTSGAVVYAYFLSKYARDWVSFKKAQSNLHSIDLI